MDDVGRNLTQCRHAFGMSKRLPQREQLALACRQLRVAKREVASRLVNSLGRIIGERLSSDAVACRTSGDEFVIAIPRCKASLAYRVADGLRRAVHASAPKLASRPFAAGTLSISVGGICASFDGRAPSRAESSSDVEAGETSFRAADAALYRAKARGRNQVCIAHREVEDDVSEAAGPDARPVSDGYREAEAAAFTICVACDADAPSRHTAADATRKSPRGNTEIHVAPDAQPLPSVVVAFGPEANGK